VAAKKKSFLFFKGREANAALRSITGSRLLLRHYQRALLVGWRPAARYRRMDSAISLPAALRSRLKAPRRNDEFFLCALSG